MELKRFIETVKACIVQEGMKAFFSNDCTTAWNEIAEGYRKCPMLIWNRVFEFNDCTVRRPILVHYAREVQQPISFVDDQNLVRKMKNFDEKIRRIYVQ